MLPLTEFEQFLLWEDRPAYPWCIFFRFDVQGLLHRSALVEAVETVLPRHPLLCSKIERHRRRWYWVPVSDPQTKIDWRSGPLNSGFVHADEIDLRTETGVKLIVVQHDDRAELTFQLHHVCCDGAGALAFINDVVIAYALLRGETSPAVKLPVIDPSRLERRGKYGLSLWRFIKKVPSQVVGIAGVIQFMKRTPVPIVPHAPPGDTGPPPTGYPNVLMKFLNRESTSKIRPAAKRIEATWNDLLVRDLFLALDGWRTDRGLERSDWLRMMIPVNLRSAGDRQMSAANCVGSVFLDRRDSDFDDPSDLLDSVQQQMKTIRENRLGLTFIFSLKLLNLLPGGLKKSARSNECSTSCIFTNLGRNLFRSPLPKKDGKLVAGDVVLERFSAAAPLRPYSVAAFLATIYAGQLALTMHYDSRVLTDSDATALFDRWEDRIHSTISISETPATIAIHE